MPASTVITPSGRVTRRPGAYSKIDASSLSRQSPGIKRMAVIGEAEGGVPVSVLVDGAPAFARASVPSKVQKLFKSGPLLAAGLLAFNASRDADVPNAPAEVLFYKVNPATQAKLTLGGVLEVVSRDYGEFTNRVSVELADGSERGYAPRVKLDDLVEEGDNVGGLAVLEVGYQGEASTLSLTKDAAGVRARFTATATAKHVEELHPGGAVRILQVSAQDAGLTATVYGVDGTGKPITERLTLGETASAHILGTTLFASVTGFALSGTPAGNVTLEATGAGAEELFTVSAGATGDGLLKGLYRPTLPVAGALTFGGGASGLVVIRGVTPAGEHVAERVLLGSAPAISANAYARLEQLELGSAPGAGGEVIELDFSGQAFASNAPTLRKLVSALGGLPGITIRALADQDASFPVADLDNVTALNIKGALPVGLKADLKALEAWFEASTLVRAQRVPGAATPPALSGVQYLLGGSEGTTTAADWQKAFTALESRKDIVVVPLSTDEAVHALFDRHLRRMESDILIADERNGYVGLPLSESVEACRKRIRQLNNRNLSAVAQAITVRDETGALVERGPEYLAVIAAAMQVGSPLATPLTWKAPNVLGFRQNAEWDPDQDAETQLENGLMFVRNDDAVGVVFERSITTYRDEDNPVFTEMSANESANESVKRSRKALRAIIGQRAFAGTASTLKTLLVAELGRQVDDGVIRAFRPEDVSIVDAGDAFAVDYAAAVIEPVNFVLLTFHATRNV